MVFNREVMFSRVTDHWSTPEHVYNALNQEFGFDFDPCPLNADFDGLSIEWGKSNFVNPPYSKLYPWCRKAHEEFKKGKLVVMLIPSKTDTKYWHEFVMEATEIRFIKGRLKFGGAKNGAPFPSSIVIFDGRRIDE